MTKTEKETIRDVIHATEIHLAIIKNNLKHNARIGKQTLEEMADGMNISLDKLEILLEETE